MTNQEMISGDPLGWDLSKLECWVASLGQENYRARQVAGWLFKKGITCPSRMTSLPRELRRSLETDCRPRLPCEVGQSQSTDGTVKYLLGLEDGERIEMVIIPEGKRNTLCFSTQVGCAVGCLFCRTGREGLVRNLTAGEIIGQVILARRLLAEGGNLTNLVAMGMGEPLLNFANVARALEIMTAGWGMAISPARVTVSTAGVIPNVIALRERFPAVNLAVSLNAPTQELRLKIMPGVRPWTLRQLMETLRNVPGRSRHQITLEYVLLGGVNDTQAHARQLSGLLAGQRMQVNLIPYNEVPGLGCVTPSTHAVSEFAALLREAGVKVLQRKSRGRDIEAACGQLRGAKSDSRHEGNSGCLKQ